METETRKKILLAEAEPAAALAESRSLEGLGYEVVVAPSGERAVELATEGDGGAPPFDLVLMELDLGPGMDGIEAARSILARRDLPLAFLSSRTGSGISERIRGIPSYGFIAKGSGEAALAASVGTALALGEKIRSERDARNAAANEARLESLLRIAQRPSSGVQELLDYALEEVIALTGSEIGYIYHYDEDKREFTLNTWSREVMHQCSVAEPRTIYSLERTGIWGEAVRQRKPILLNDFASPDPLKRGLPEGHAPLRRFLTVPVFSDGAIVAVVGVANKAVEYGEADIRQLELMMDSVWKVVLRNKAEEELRRREARIAELLKEKEALLAEVHHRIRNFLNTIQALLVFQSETCDAAVTASALRDTAGRVDSMRLLYDKLYGAEWQGTLSLRDYLPDLIVEIMGLFPPRARIRVDAELEDISLDAKTLAPLGIIINEIVTNSMKYAFADRTEGTIILRARGAEGRVRIEIGDDGAGMQATQASPGGFGLRLLPLLIEQLHGELRLLEGPGLVYELAFPA